MDPAVILNLAYAVLIGATRMRTVRTLRLALIGGAGLFVTYGAVVGLRSMVVWNGLIGIIHLMRLIADIRASRSAMVEDHVRIIHHQLMPELSDVDFQFLWDNSEEVVHLDATVVQPGEIPANLSLVLQGRVDVLHHGEQKFQRGQGAMLGAISFMSKAPASFEARSVGAVTVRQWNVEWLGSLEDRNRACARAMLNLVGRDLAATAGLLPMLVPATRPVSA